MGTRHIFDTQKTEPDAHVNVYIAARVAAGTEQVAQPLKHKSSSLLDAQTTEPGVHVNEYEAFKNQPPLQWPGLDASSLLETQKAEPDAHVNVQVDAHAAVATEMPAQLPDPNLISLSDTQETDPDVHNDPRGAVDAQETEPDVQVDAPAAADTPQQPPKPKASSLLDKLGGSNAVRAAVDLLYGKIMSDSQLSPFFEGVDMGKQHGMQVIELN